MANTEERVRDLKDTLRRSNIQSCKERERNHRAEEILKEIMAKIFLKLIRDNKPQIQEDLIPKQEK